MTGVIRRLVAVLVCGIAVSSASPAQAATQLGRVVVVTIPGFSWDTLRRARTPVLDALVDDGAVAAVSVRAATRGSTPLRGYLTLGAGNRTLVEAQTKPRRDVRTGQVALRASDSFENGTAAAAMARRVVRPRPGQVVVPDAPALDAAQRQVAYGSHVGELGASLARGGIGRAVVAAADLAVAPRQRSMRRGAALSVVDASGTVDVGTVSGLVRASPDDAFGVVTDDRAFTEAVDRALRSARVVVVEPGETLRADEFALDAAPREADAQNRRALERTDALIGRIAGLLAGSDTLYVVGVSSPLADPHDHLTLAVAHGNGIRRGWLTSATTHRRGMVTLTDFAPTVLARFGRAAPKSMSGTPIRSVASSARDRVAVLASLDARSRFADRFQGFATKLVVGLLGAIALTLAAAVWRSTRWRPAVEWLSLAVLAVPATAYIARALPVQRLGFVGASITACAIAALLASAAKILPLPAWKSAVVLIGIGFLWTAGDLLAGAPLQVNNVFGYSPISAGRFYGNSNVAFAILVASTLLGVFGVLELRGRRTIPLWAVIALVATVAIQGLPQFGADFGGVAASIPAILVAYAIARGRRVRLWRVATWAAAGAVAAVAVALVDAARPPQTRTHLGRFAADLLSGGAPGVADVVTRKFQSNLAVLGSAWTLTVPAAAIVAVLLLRRNPHLVHDLLATRPMVAAGLAGTLVAGVVGFAVNDTGIWVLGMTLAFVVPVAVLAAPALASPGSLGSTEDGIADVQGPAEAAGFGRQGRPQE